MLEAIEEDIFKLAESYNQYLNKNIFYITCEDKRSPCTDCIGGRIRFKHKNPHFQKVGIHCPTCGGHYLGVYVGNKYRVYPGILKQINIDFHVFRNNWSYSVIFEIVPINNTVEEDFVITVDNIHLDEYEARFKALVLQEREKYR